MFFICFKYSFTNSFHAVSIISIYNKNDASNNNE